MGHRRPAKRQREDEYGGYGFEGGAVPLRPLVKIHPETGRPSLLIGRHAHAIPGLDPAESEKLLDELVEFACQPPRTCPARVEGGRCGRLGQPLLDAPRTAVGPGRRRASCTTRGSRGIR